MKSVYGTWVTRFLAGGVTLDSVEAAVLEHSVAAPPAELKDPLLAQHHAVVALEHSWAD